MRETIIFDLGGVLYDIAPERSLSALARLGVSLSATEVTGSDPQSIIHAFECGRLSVDEFIAALRERVDAEVAETADDQTLRAAASALLVGFTAERIAYLQMLRADYQLCLLSNTNALHIAMVEEQLAADYRIAGLAGLFDHVFLSYELGLRKPDEAIYTRVIDTLAVPPRSCLFVDDLAENTAAAARCGLSVLHKPMADELCTVLPAYLAGRA